MAVATILEDIVEHKKDEVSAAKAHISQAELEARFEAAGSTRGFCQAVRNKIEAKQPAVIAEIKKASPSKGLIRADFDPARHAFDYAENGATCLSVLTDKKYFQGADSYLQEARNSCSLPVLRKDFMIDSYQIAESKVLGADCILLIVAALQQSQLVELAAYANSIDIDVLIEVHDKAELERALQLDTEIIGINNRNLHNFETSLQTTLELSDLVPGEKMIVTESGINSVSDVKTMIDAGIYGFLVGESFMRAEHPGIQLKELFFADE